MEGRALQLQPAYFTVALRKAPQLSEANAVTMSLLRCRHYILTVRAYGLPISILPHDSVFHALFPDTNFPMGSP